MKKLVLCSLLFVLFSCTSREEYVSPDVNDISVNRANLESSKSTSSREIAAAVLEGGNNITLKCAGGSSFINPININPNFPYITNKEVLYYDNSSLFGRNQIILSEFVATNVFGWNTNNPFLPEIFFHNTSSNFYTLLNSNNNYYLDSFTISQDSDNASLYGDMFGGNNTYSIMTNDAANTVYHAFEAYKRSLQSQNKAIVGVLIATDQLLCVPSVKYIKMTVVTYDI